MPLRYKVDILTALKEKGYNTNRIRTEGLLSQSTLQKFRNKQGVSWENLETLCDLLECQPGDLIEYVSIKQIEDEIFEVYIPLPNRFGRPENDDN